MKLQKGNVFRSVCQELSPQGVVSQHALAQTPLRTVTPLPRAGTPPGQVHPLAGTPPGRYTTPRQVHPPSIHIPLGRYTPQAGSHPSGQVHPPGQVHPTMTVTAADSTHPTGLLSC